MVPAFLPASCSRQILSAKPRFQALKSAVRASFGALSRTETLKVGFAACICPHPCRLSLSPARSSDPGTARSWIALIPEQCGTDYEVALKIKSAKHWFIVCARFACRSAEFCTQSVCEGFAGRCLSAFWPSKTLNPSSTWESMLVVQAVPLNPSLNSPELGERILSARLIPLERASTSGNHVMCFSGKEGDWPCCYIRH